MEIFRQMFGCVKHSLLQSPYIFKWITCSQLKSMDNLRGIYLHECKRSINMLCNFRERFRFCLKFALCHMAMRINENELGSIWLIAFKSVQFSSAYIGLAHFKSAQILAHYLVSTIIIIQTRQDILIITSMAFQSVLKSLFSSVSFVLCTYVSLLFSQL